MAWTVEYDPRVEKDLKAIDRAMQREILDYMDTRIATDDDPRRFGKLLRHELRGLWRYRVRDYRIIADIRVQKPRGVRPEHQAPFHCLRLNPRRVWRIGSVDFPARRHPLPGTCRLGRCLNTYLRGSLPSWRQLLSEDCRVFSEVSISFCAQKSGSH